MTLNAKITTKPSTATAAGTVQFKNGDANLGEPETVINGTASITSTLDVGSHQLSTVFIPADTKVTGSTSETVTFQVNPPAADTNFSQGVPTDSSAAANTAETHNAAVYRRE